MGVLGGVFRNIACKLKVLGDLTVNGKIFQGKYYWCEDFDDEATNVQFESGLQADFWTTAGTNYAAGNVLYTNDAGGTLDAKCANADNDSVTIIGLGNFRVDSNPIMEARFKIDNKATAFMGVGFAEGAFATKATPDDDIFLVGIDSDAVAAVGTITMTGVATADETFVIDTQTYTWKATRSGTGEVTIGANQAAAVTNIVTAITADQTTVTAADGAGDTVVVTSVAKGITGNAIVFTEASTNMAVDGAGTLGTTTAGLGHNFGATHIVSLSNDHNGGAIYDDMGVAIVNDTYIKVKIDLTDTEQPKVWINDVEVASASITGTVQAAITVAPYMMVQNLAGAAIQRLLTVDYIKVWQDRG